MTPPALTCVWCNITLGHYDTSSDIDGNIDITHYSPAASQDVSIMLSPGPGPRNTEHSELRSADLETQTSAFVRANYEPSTQKYSRSIVQYQQQHEYSKI